MDIHIRLGKVIAHNAFQQSRSELHMKQGMAQNEPAQPIYEGLTRNAAIILMFVAFMLTSAVGRTEHNEHDFGSGGRVQHWHRIW